MNFKDTFTANLPKHVRNRIHTITVKTDFNNLPVKGSNENVQNTLCGQTFQRLNIEKVVTIKFPSKDKDDSGKSAQEAA